MIWWFLLNWHYDPITWKSFGSRHHHVNSHSCQKYFSRQEMKRYTICVLIEKNTEIVLGLEHHGVSLLSYERNCTLLLLFIFFFKFSCKVNKRLKFSRANAEISILLKILIIGIIKTSYQFARENLNRNRLYMVFVQNCFWSFLTFLNQSINFILNYWKK